MKNLSLIVVGLALLGLSAAYWIDGVYGNQLFDEDDSTGTFSEDKRRSLSHSEDLCIPWRAPCPSDASLSKQYTFLRCCGGLSCKCTFWGNNCKCESRLGR